MNIEAMLLAKNRKAYDRIANMIKSLIVKNTLAASNAETVETAAAYAAYETAYEETDSVVSYNYTQQDLIKYGFTPSEALRYYTAPKSLQSIIMSGSDTRAVAFISALRKERVASYVENNSYYRPFVGLPEDSSEYIVVSNTDKKKPTDPDTIYLHQVNYITYPKTYNRLFYERDIDAIYKSYTYQYLKFIEKPMTPYTVHNKRQFDICYYSSSAMLSNELPVFFDAYNAAKEEILTIDYIESFEETYPAYVGIMFMLLLSYAFNLYCAKTLERYAVRDYTEEEMYDILDSTGHSTLKEIDVSLLKNVVMNLPDLDASIGTQNIIDVIFDVVADETLSIKRYYLTKKYSVDGNGDATLSKIADGSTYNDGVDLVFEEKTVKRGKQASFTTDSTYTYSEVVMEDDTWGNTHDIEDTDTKKAIKDEIRRELLAQDFSTIMTKYISLSKIVDMYAKTIEINNKLGIFYQINADRGNFLRTDTVLYHGMEVSVLSIYAAWCMVYAKYSGVTNYDYIVTSASTVSGVIKLRSVEHLHTDVLAAKNVSIDLGNGYSRTLGYYLTDQEIQDHMVSFKCNEATSIQSILDQYEENYAIIKAIEEKLKKQNNVAEYNVWNIMYKANVISRNITNLFSGYTSYMGYIKNFDPEFWKYIEPFIDDNTIGTRKALIDLATTLKTSFSNYVSSMTSGEVKVLVDEDDIVGGENLSDIGTLFNEFMSSYTQMFKQDFHVGFNDPTNNSLWLLYTKVMESFITKDSSYLNLVQTMLNDTLYSKATAGNLELLYYTTDTLKSEQFFDLVLAFKQIHEILKFSRREFINLDETEYRDTLISRNSGSLVFEDVIRIIS